MTLDVTIRQKLVRVVSSAMACGLSISFVVGEMVDYKAAEISRWKSDSRILPHKYLPLQPLAASLLKIKVEEVKSAFIALNSEQALPGKVQEDSIRTVLAAPARKQKILGRLPPASDSTLPGKAVLNAKLKEQSEKIRSEDVEKVLLSLHNATARLSDPKREKSPLQKGAVASGSIIVKVLPDAPARGSDPAPVQEVVIPVADSKPEPEEKIIGPETPATVAVTEAGGPRRSPSGTEELWLIRGKVINRESARLKGHYEIGLFTKVDQDGIPVGYPIVQQILPAGALDFELKVPANVEKGFLYGEFVAARTGKRSWIAPALNPWLKESRQFAELEHRPEQGEDKVSSVAAASLFNEGGARKWKISGAVHTLFSREPIPQQDVIVKVRGRKESARTDKNGSFHLELPRLRGTVYLEFLKAGYHPALVPVPVEGDQNVKVDLASRDAIDQIARRLGARQISSKAVFIGKAANGDGSALKGLTVQTSLKADGPYYFSEDGFPSTGQKATSGDGRFLFLNLEPGTGLVEPSLNGEAISPFLLSTVEGGEMVVKDIVPVTGTISGRIFNPVTARGKLLPIGGGRIRIEGAAEWTNTDSYGAFSIGPVRWIRGEKISLEFSAERFNNHRYLMDPGEKKSVNLFAFPAVYIGRLAKAMDVELDSQTGIVLGKVTGLSVRIDALADHSVANSARDFYFDSRGRIRGSHMMTDKAFGTYIVFNVPKGRALIQGNDSEGVLRYSDAAVSSPASISILMDQ